MALTLEQFANKALSVPFLARGRSYEGWDCYGLCRVAYQDCYNILLPSLHNDYHDVHYLRTLNQVIVTEQANWLDIEWGSEKPGDIMLFSMGKFIVHVGLVLPKYLVLDAREGHGTCTRKYRGGLPLGMNFAGFCRHATRSHI